MRLLLISVLAVAMIGLMVPTTFAELKENDNIFVQNPDCNISKVVYADGSPVWKPGIKFFDKEGNLVSEHRANTDGEFINISEGYIIQVIIYENDQVSDYAETYNQCYIPPEPKLPPKPHIPYQEPKQIQEYLDRQKEGLEASLSDEAKKLLENQVIDESSIHSDIRVEQKKNEMLTENEYYALIDAIYAKGDEYNLQCSQKYGPPFNSMNQQFAYNDCMNAWQSWLNNELYQADSKCCAQDGGGCLIATAAYGSELAPQVQFLRELRDNTVLQTQSGTTFMNGFNQFYYSFSPAVANYERENPVFKEAVKVTLTPLLTSLTLLNYVEIDTEEEMLGYGIGIILLNVGMYFVAPAAIILQIKRWKSKN